MRIVSGTHRGRSIHPPKNLTARPTTDFAKESLFNILNNHVDFTELRILDLFAGTGNISYEFASRGATTILAVDSSFAGISFIRKTAADLAFDSIRAVKSDVFSFLRTAGGKYDIIFADPPYDLEKLPQIPELVQAAGILDPDGWLIVEHGPRTDLSKLPGFDQQRVYGNVNFSFFRHPATAEINPTKS